MEASNLSTDPFLARERQELVVAQKTKRRRIWITVCFGVGVAITGTGIAWLGATASTIKTELEAANHLLPRLKDEVMKDEIFAATETVRELQLHTAAAREASTDPLWAGAQSIPWAGVNFEAATEVATSADDVARLAAAPLLDVFRSLNWENLAPGSNGLDLVPLAEAQPSLVSAAHAVRQSSERLDRLNSDELLPQVSTTLSVVKEQLTSLKDHLDTAANTATIAPDMMGAQGPRRYLLMIQNNAEARASGGIPGALAILTFDKGKLSLGEQSSAVAVGITQPTLLVDAEQQQIYSSRMGKFMQDVNLTPDFPTTGRTAQEMWERKKGLRVDGVISIDPVALGYILDATGPVRLTNPELVALADGGLPTELSEKNVVPTLLSDVYDKIEQPQLQDAYYAGVAQEVFSALSSGKGDANSLIAGMTRGTAEGRVLLWSDKANEQSIIAKYPLSGSIAGSSVAPAQFGVYFNDGTGAKMDYYVKRTVQIVEECTGDEYGQVNVRITSTNTAPMDAATSLPEYVTGGGVFGVPAGSVQTNIVAYGPFQSNVVTARVDGRTTNFASYGHSNRPVGTLAVRLAPGETQTVDFTFAKIVQHTEPNVVVTPTVQNVKDVILPTKKASCGP